MPCTEATTTIRPSPDPRSAGHAARASRNGLVSRSATIASQRSSGNSATGATCWKPALGISVSSRPKRSSAAATAAWLPSRVVRSAGNGSPGPSGSGSRSTASTRAPSRSSRPAIAPPIPLAAPVTTAARSMASVFQLRERAADRQRSDAGGHEVRAVLVLVEVDRDPLAVLVEQGEQPERKREDGDEDGPDR